MKLVMNSSTTILLAKTNLLRTVDEQFEEVMIPKEVYMEAVEESKRLGYDDASITEKEVRDKRIEVKRVKDERMTGRHMQDFAMRKGEAETIVLALEEKADLLATDDYQCMKTCRALEIPFTQAISLIVALFENKRLSKRKAVEAIERLRDYGWYADWIIEDAKNKVR